jgi:broad specificity phosphatase PhoE
LATELILIRHGNAVRINGDYFHAPLTKLGQEQASKTGQYFSIRKNHLDGFYSSPLRRTQETAHIIGSKIGKKPEMRSGVQEVRFTEPLPGQLKGGYQKYYWKSCRGILINAWL